MKDEYFSLLRENNINDILSMIKGLSYSVKFNTIKNLLEKYSSVEINRALNDYLLDYIRIGRAYIPRMNTMLNFLCKRYHE